MPEPDEIRENTREMTRRSLFNAAHQVFAAHHPEGQAANPTAVRHSQSRANEIVLTPWICVTKDPQRLRIESIRTDLALHGVGPTTPTHHEVDFAT